MTNKLKRLTDLENLRLLFDPRGYVDSPKPIQDAFYGRPPEPKLRGAGAIFRLMGWYYVISGMLVALFIFIMMPWLSWGIRVGQFFVTPLLLGIWSHLDLLKDERREYARGKEQFDAFTVDVDLFKDEIFKAAVAQLPDVDFQGRHRPMNEAMIGKLERETIEEFRKLGIRQELTVENRGRPFLVHQYELTELGWVDPESGERRNYTLDLAILWPERRIKYNVEIDGPSHSEPAQRAKDHRRNAVLTERGWFVRRFNHTFFAQGHASGGIREVVRVVYFFAKYANEQPFNWEARLGAWLQNCRRQKAYRKERNAIEERKLQRQG